MLLRPWARCSLDVVEPIPSGIVLVMHSQELPGFCLLGRALSCLGIAEADEAGLVTAADRRLKLLRAVNQLRLCGHLPE